MVDLDGGIGRMVWHRGATMSIGSGLGPWLWKFQSDEDEWRASYVVEDRVQCGCRQATWRSAPKGRAPVPYGNLQGRRRADVDVDANVDADMVMWNRRLQGASVVACRGTGCRASLLTIESK